MTLAGYLEKIRQGKPVNYENFLRCLPADISARHMLIFSTTRVGAQRWLVTCQEAGLIEKLQSAATKPDDRVAAAVLGNSHQTVSEAAILLVYHSLLVDSRPGVVYLSADETVQDFKCKPLALLIENQQNFVQSAAMLRIASAFCGQLLTLENTDVVYGGGSRVNSARITSWLSHYDDIICAFDFDLGGLRMFRALKKRLGIQTTFLQPPDWAPFRDYFIYPPRTTKRFLQAIDLATQLGFTGLAEVIHQTGHFMEQESLLAEPSALERL
ncbi:hypothetical protein [Allohahella marinimesophila]|uniref:Wadjet protein JetD C-terminal domain-containing protein n=1 Tax=Allohahella marinimesophila TaxID=1054972 RepID=A0ABP7NI00_9GAMM